MLENLNLKRKLAREEYNRVLPGLQGRLYDLEKTCWDHKVASIVVFEGWDAAGKGGDVSRKCFLRLSEKEQKERFKKIEADPPECWRGSKKDWARHRKYPQYLAAVEDMLELTAAGTAPWTIVEATSRGWARKKILDA